MIESFGSWQDWITHSENPVEKYAAVHFIQLFSVVQRLRTELVEINSNLDLARTALTEVKQKHNALLVWLSGQAQLTSKAQLANFELTYTG